MRNLLHANFFRLFHSGAFRAAVAAEFAYALFIIGVTFYSIYIKESGQFGLEEPLLFAFGTAGIIPVPMFIQAPFLSVYLGTEFSEGTIRNKLVSGRSKVAVYLSNWLTCMTASVLLAVLYLALVGAAVAPTGLPLKMPAGQLLPLVCCGLLALSASASLPLVYLTETNKPSPMSAPGFGGYGGDADPERDEDRYRHPVCRDFRHVSDQLPHCSPRGAGVYGGL